MAKVLIGNFKGPKGDQGVKGDPGTAASIQVGTTQTVQPEENAEIINTGTTSAAVLNFKIPRGEDGMTDLTAEYKDDSSYTCQPTVNAPAVVKGVDGKTEQGENPSPDNLQVIKGVGGMGYFDGTLQSVWYDSSGNPTPNINYYSSDKIECNAGDVIKVEYEQNVDALLLYYWNANGEYISHDSAQNSNIIQKSAPANTKYFAFSANASNIGNSPAKYCTVTINGKYQTGVETTGKNLCPPVSEWIYNSLQNRYETKIFLKGGKKYYASSNIPEPSGNQFVYYFLNTGNAVSKNYTKTYTPQKDEYIDMYAYMGRAYSEDALKGTYYIQVEEGESPTDYTPYHHTSLSIPLTSPLYSGDKICYVKPGESYVNAEGETVVADRILYGVYRENATVVFDGSESWINYDVSVAKGFYIYENDVPVEHGMKTPDNVEMNNSGYCNILPVDTGGLPAIQNRPGVWIGYENIEYFYVHSANPSIATDVNNWKTWLQSHNMTVVYPIAAPYFEPFVDQTPFYTLRTDDTLSYVYSTDPIEPVLTVEVAKNSTGGYLLESYAQTQKNAISEANSQSRLSAIEQQLVNQATTPTE